MATAMNLTMKIVGLAKAKTQLAAAKREVENTKPLFDKAVIILEKSHAKTFRVGGRPKWEKSQRASRQGGQTLINIGRLRGSVTARSAGSIREYRKDELRFGTKIVYAPAHQFGLPSKGIPKRPFLGVYQEDIKLMEKVFKEDLDGRLKVVTTLA